MPLLLHTRPMKIQFIVCLLSMLSTAYAGEKEFKEPTEVEFQAANEKEIRKRARDNPELAMMLQAHDEQLVVEKMESQVAVEAQSKTRDFAPSIKIADDAFSKGDYKTALKHYEALGEEGNGRASMVAGLIYSDVEGAGGIETDKAKAAAWLERSIDQGETAGADLYEKMDTNNELTEEEKIEAKNLIHEFRESDAKLMKDQQTLITDSYSSGTYSPIFGIVSQQHASKSELVQTGNANIYAATTDTEASFSPTRSSRGDYSYQPEKALLRYSLPARE